MVLQALAVAHMPLTGLYDLLTRDTTETQHPSVGADKREQKPKKNKKNCHWTTAFECTASGSPRVKVSVTPMSPQPGRCTRRRCTVTTAAFECTVTSGPALLTGSAARKGTGAG